MPDQDQLHTVVKKVEKDTLHDAHSQTIVAIDLTPDRIGLFKKWAYYLVSHNIKVKDSLVVPVEGFEQGWILHLGLDYEAAVSKNGLPHAVARVLVEVLRGKTEASENFQQALQLRLRTWIDAYVTEHGGAAEFIRQYERHPQLLSAYIRSRAEREVGLDLLVKIKAVVPDQEIEEVKSVKKPVVIELRDYPTAIPGTLNLDLAAMPGIWAYIHHQNVDKLCELLVTRTRVFMKQKTLHEVHFERERVREELAAELDRFARAEGRTAQSLKLPCASPVSTDVVKMATPTKPITCIKTYSLIEYPYPIEVTCELKMELINLGAFIASKPTNLDGWAERWAESTFGDIIQKHLLDVSYIELFRQPAGDHHPGFATYDNKIEHTKAAIRAAAQKLGFNAYSVALRTNLQFDELRREFRISIDRGPGEFEMKVPKSPAALNIEVVARIADEKIIKELFLQDADIKKVIRKEIKEVVSNKLKSTSPERYYIYFDGTHEQGQTSLLEELRAMITSTMKEKYKATVLAVNCVRTHTEELLKIYEALIAEEREFNIIAEHSKLQFNVVFGVTHVVPGYWFEFQAKRPTLDRVQNRVQHYVGEWLAPKTRELLRRTDEPLKLDLNRFVQDSVEEEFGVGVKITNLTRLRSEEDDAINEKFTESVVDRIRNYPAEDDDERKLQRLIENSEILHTQEKVALGNGTFEDMAMLKQLIQENEEQIEKVRERLRSRNVGRLLERNIDNHIGSMGGGSIQNVPALPAPAAPAVAKSAIAASERMPNDATANGRR
jgi:hypothetical protein